MTPSALAQAGEPTFELHTLGWKGFQNLCATIAAEVWGQTVQTFLDTRDGGRDGAFRGVWSPKGGEVYSGAFVAQCKFTSAAGQVITVGQLSEELRKARRLAARGLCDNYFLFTNARLTGENDEKIREAFLSIPGVRNFAAFGLNWISQAIRESSRLRMLVPRVYGLGDLSQILDERAYAQTREIITSLGDDLSKFVITEAYRRSAQALIEEGIVLLLGEPACGKSTIAAALSLGAADEWGCFPIKLRGADDLVTHSNPHEHKQFFWVDDAFGATQLDTTLVSAWNRALPHLNAAIRRGARVVFTSRDYVYKAAKDYLKESALPALRKSQVVIQVERLTKDEREQILYNHMKLGTQPADFKERIRPFLQQVAEHRRFSPETARRLGHPTFTPQLKVSKSGVDDFVSHPMDFLKEVIQTLDRDSQCAIALIYMRAGTLPSPLELTADEETAVEMIGGTPSGVRRALASLIGSLVIYVRQDGESAWRFKHPTIRDAFAAMVAENPELLDIYLAGARVETLLREVSCGDLEIEGAKVIVPAGRYELVMNRIGVLSAGFNSERDPDRWEPVHDFLAYRCDRWFLETLIEKRPDFLSTLRLAPHMAVVSDVSVIAKLHELGLLPESERLRHLAAIRRLAVETPDSGFLIPRVRALITSEELRDIAVLLQTELLPNLTRKVHEWHDAHDREGDPESHFEFLRAALSDYREMFNGDAASTAEIDAALRLIEKSVEELWIEMPPDEDPDRGYDARASSGSWPDTRSIFDDVAD